MATTYQGICLEDFYPAPDEDPTFKLRRGEEYILGSERPDGTRRVFTTYWCFVPSRLFAGVRPFTK